MSMNRSLGIVRDTLICLIVLVFMIGVFLGAVLQESYKLAPVTAEEIAEVSR